VRALEPCRHSPSGVDSSGSSGLAVNLLDCAEDHRRGAPDRPADQVPRAVAVMDLSESLFDRDEFAFMDIASLTYRRECKYLRRSSALSKDLDRFLPASMSASASRMSFSK
jgi:hypothetical protein